MAAAMVLAIAVPAAIAELIGRGLLRGRRLIYLVGATIVLALTLLVLGLVAPRRFLSAEDLQLIGQLFTAAPEWRAPALVNGDDYVLVSMDGEALHGLVLAVLAGLALIAARFRREPPPSAGQRTTAWLVIALAILIGLPWLAVDDAQGLGFRLRIAAFVPGALCAAIACGQASRWLAPRTRAIALVVVAALIAANAPRRTELEGEVLAHPALVSAVMQLDGLVSPEDTILVPHRQLAFMVAWYARATVAIRPSDAIPRERRWRLLPRSFTIHGSQLDRALLDALREPSIVPPVGLHSGDPNGLVLISEPTWEWLLAHMKSPKARDYFGGWPTR